MGKKISIIMPVYNEEKTLGCALDSLVKQTYDMSETELLVIDGRSTDRTRQIAESFGDRLPIRILDNEKRQVTYALNIGIENAVGDYIIRLDAHSEYAADYIEKCCWYLDHTDADNVGGVAETKGNTFWGRVNADILSSRFGVGNSDFRTGAQSGYVDTVPFGAFRREVFERVGLFNPALPRSEDNDINSRIRQSGGKVYLASDIHFTYYCRSTLGGLLRQAIQNGNALFFTLKENKKAMSLRHFVPFCFMLSLLILVPLSFVSKLFAVLLAAEAVAYLLLDCLFSFRDGEKKYFFLKLWIYPLFHFSYGLGSALSLVGVKLY